jgi:predicted acetyltransferase
MTDDDVTLSAVSRLDGPLLGNLLELYTHDMSAVFDVILGPDGRFGYPHLESYLSGVGDRFAFLIRYRKAVAGFALVTRGSPVAEEPDVLDLAEYFVLRRFRRVGLGSAAAGLLWDRLPAVWTVRAAVVHSDAVAFWRAVVAAYTHGTASESERRLGSKDWVVFSFDSAHR